MFCIILYRRPVHNLPIMTRNRHRVACCVLQQGRQGRRVKQPNKYTVNVAIFCSTDEDITFLRNVCNYSPNGMPEDL